LFSIVWFLPKRDTTNSKAQGRAGARANSTMRNKEQPIVRHCLILVKLRTIPHVWLWLYCLWL